MPDDLSSRLTSDDIRRFEQAVSKLDAGVTRQEEIAKKVLKIEKEIADVRLGALKPYFDEYSKGLDTIIARKTSKLNDGFLIAETFIHKLKDTLGEASGKAIESVIANTADAAKKAADEIAASSSSGGGGGDDELSTVSTRQQGLSKEDSASLLANGETSKGIIAKLIDFENKYETVNKQTEAIVKKQYDAVVSIDQIKAYRQQERKKADEEHIKTETSLEENLIKLQAARLREREDRENAARAVQDKAISENIANLRSEQELINAAQDRWNYDYTVEGIKMQKELELHSKAEVQKSIQELELKRAGFIARAERKYKLEHGLALNKELSAEELKDIKRLADAEYKLSQENIDKLTEERLQKEEAERHKKQKQEANSAIDNATSLTSKTSVVDRIDSMKELVNKAEADGADRGQAQLAVAIKSLSSIAQQLEDKIDAIAGYKGAIDTRLQGSNNEVWAGSYWDQLVHDMTSVGAINPYFKQEDFANNIKSLVDTGIAFDLKQRAFLMTIQSKIATTFEVADGTLLRLIRLQQEDSTAGRLGMESALNAFLNNMYENTEYLKQVADGVRSSLEEMESLMSGADAAEVEYQVQKWLGSLYSVGMSQSAVQSISTALGQIAAGQIEGLSNGGAGNLLIMAANDAGVPIADILTNGITADETNKLLQAAVNYLAELADSSKDNKIVQQQLAEVFGVRASDLRAATNLVTSTDDVYSSSLTYSNMLKRLNDMAGSMASRTSLAEMMTNIWDNGMYTVAGSMASNPVSYFIYKAASLLDATAGGISIPGISVMGNMVDLETTVADLMRVAAVGTGILGSFGSIVSGLGNSFSGQKMLSQLGIESGSGLVVTPRGNSINLLSSPVGGGSQNVSESYYAGNASGSDIKNSTMQEAEDSKKQQMITAKEEESANQIDSINSTVLKIYELLDAVANGKSSLSVKVEGYGLTKANSSGGSIGGVAALDDTNNAIGASSLSSSSVSGNISLGGWTSVAL